MQKIVPQGKNQAPQSGITIAKIDDLFRYFAAFYGRKWESGLPSENKDLKKVKYVWYDSLHALHPKDFEIGISMIQSGRAFADFPPTPGLFYNLCIQSKKSRSGFHSIKRIGNIASEEVAQRYLKEIMEKLGQKRRQAKPESSS